MRRIAKLSDLIERAPKDGKVLCQDRSRAEELKRMAIEFGRPDLVFITRKELEEEPPCDSP